MVLGMVFMVRWIVWIVELGFLVISLIVFYDLVLDGGYSVWIVVFVLVRVVGIFLV